MSTTAVRPSFLLVHGAWHRSTCWAPLQDALAADGWQSHTVDLPSSGPQRTPTAGMLDDAEEIAAHLRRIEGPVVVVGHSYAGAPVTQGAADLPHVAHLVYLTAYMPAEDESLRSIHGGAPREEDLSGLAPLVFADPRTALYGDVPDDVAEQAMARLVDQSRRSFQQPVTRVAWRTVPSTYVICEDDQALPPSLQAKMSAHATHVKRLGTGHCPFLSAPADLAKLLGRIAEAAVAD
ncbi:hypothetical protein A6A06_13025 [Streptomyces sp. CB02923]|uniref:alpha/beta hydrolase n=1 Tax=Streptomyces sp. CB02923 TaxID=1718985 RepID=UPI00093FED85|nr:alpha/beta hydrolase [Streptomyces sp. CB02923]OKI02024.1 hypothetical protein A6A06_13025 [Streptomyces sp. CB02923]